METKKVLILFVFAVFCNVTSNGYILHPVPRHSRPRTFYDVMRSLYSRDQDDAFPWYRSLTPRMQASELLDSQEAVDCREMKGANAWFERDNNNGHIIPGFFNWPKRDHLALWIATGYIKTIEVGDRVYLTDDTAHASYQAVFTPKVLSTRPAYKEGCVIVDLELTMHYKDVICSLAMLNGVIQLICPPQEVPPELKILTAYPAKYPYTAPYFPTNGDPACYIICADRDVQVCDQPAKFLSVSTNLVDVEYLYEPFEKF